MTQPIPINLEAAAARGDAATVQAIVERQDALGDPWYGGSIHEALCRAAEYGHQACVDILLPRGDTFSQGDALVYAAFRGDLAMMGTVLKLNLTSYDQALLAAAWTGQHEALRQLLPHGNPQAEDSIALYKAASCKHPECVDLLLPHSDVDSVALQLSGQGYWYAIEYLVYHVSLPVLATLAAVVTDEARPRLQERWAVVQTANLLREVLPEGARATTRGRRL